MLLLLAAYLFIGIGFGFANAPIINTAVNGLPPARAGVAGAITSTARPLGAAPGSPLPAVWNQVVMPPSWPNRLARPQRGQAEVRVISQLPA
ncbi:hypothetical protein [Streptomyces longwoodensis]|uniref:hypothetical protein n=1 Tax=Streptomyces longwoodensis TaxID=68231 RepID=UPI00384C4A5F